MFLSLQVSHFRNLKNQSFQFSPSLNLIVGENGQGKTNLIESIYLTCRGESFRFAKVENLVAYGKTESLVQISAEKKQLRYDLRLLIQNKRKELRINDKKVSFGVVADKFPIVLFSPESLSSIKSGSDARRELVDDLLVTLDGRKADLLQEFKKCLRTRNKLLSSYNDPNTSKDQTIRVLESLEPQFLSLATDLVMERITALRAVQPFMNQSFCQISDTNVDISVEYVVSGENSLEKSRLDIENMLKKRLSELRFAELETGTSLVGPHKHDINFLYNGNDSRIFCSQGQQRALILSFKLAQIVYHRRVHEMDPVLLLDDVLSELDLRKQESLIRFLGEIKSQVFVTTTDFELNQKFETFKNQIKVIRMADGLSV